MAVVFERENLQMVVLGRVLPGVIGIGNGLLITVLV